MAETNPEERLGVLRLQVFMEVVYGCRAELRVPRTIADKETIQLCVGWREEGERWTREEGERWEMVEGSARGMRKKKW